MKHIYSQLEPFRSRYGFSFGYRFSLHAAGSFFLRRGLYFVFGTVGSREVGVFSFVLFLLCLSGDVSLALIPRSAMLKPALKWLAPIGCSLHVDFRLEWCVQYTITMSKVLFLQLDCVYRSHDSSVLDRCLWRVGGLPVSLHHSMLAVTLMSLLDSEAVSPAPRVLQARNVFCIVRDSF